MGGCRIGKNVAPISINMHLNCVCLFSSPVVSSRPSTKIFPNKADLLPDQRLGYRGQYRDASGLNEETSLCPIILNARNTSDFVVESEARSDYLLSQRYQRYRPG